MSFSSKVTQISNTRLNATGKSTLNPNASEFIPSFSISTLPGSSCAIQVSLSPAASAANPHQSAEIAVLHRSKSSVSNNSDEEARQYWSRQLPDDITPDFNDEELKGLESLSLEGLSLEEATDGLRFASSTSSRFVLNQHQEFSPHHDGSSFTTSLGTPVSSFGPPPSSGSFLNVNAKAWETPTSNKNLVLENSSNRTSLYGGNTGDFIDDILSDGMVDSNEVDSLAFLANQFPGFAYESLAEVYLTNQQDMIATVEMLNQLELQVDAGFSKVTNSKSPSALNPNAPVFHSHNVLEGQNYMRNYTSDGLRQSIDLYQPSDRDSRLLFSPTSSIPMKSLIDLDSGIRNLSFQKSSSWKHEGNGSIDLSIGSSRSSNLLASYNSKVSPFGGKVPSPSSGNKTSVWSGNGQAVGNVHPEPRDEILQHAGLLNTYLQQARPSYSIVDKPANEVDTQVPSRSMRMKPMHVESIYSQSNRRREERTIDVHDLHVTDAIHVLSHELNTIRSAARASDQSLPVCIRVGSDNHTRGAFTPAKLPAAVRRYLLEEERLVYSELQPGLLRVVIC
ncbi:unnamed protein product [Rhodiola kirilowii]